MKKTFYVMLSDPVMTLDLTSALGDQFPDDQVVTGSVSELAAGVPLAPEVCVFAGREALTGVVSQVLAGLSAAGGHVILIGVAGCVGFPATLLDIPFTNQMLLSALSSAGPDATGNPLAGHT